MPSYVPERESVFVSHKRTALSFGIGRSFDIFDIEIRYSIRICMVCHVTSYFLQYSTRATTIQMFVRYEQGLPRRYQPRQDDTHEDDISMSVIPCPHPNYNDMGVIVPVADSLEDERTGRTVVNHWSRFHLVLIVPENSPDRTSRFRR